MIIKSKLIKAPKANGKVASELVTLTYKDHFYTVAVEGEPYKVTPNQLFAVQSFNAI